MQNFQSYIFPFLFFCLTQPKEDILGINKSTNQLLMTNEQVFHDQFSLRHLPQINASLDITNFHPLCTTNTCNTTFNRKFKSMSDIKKELFTKCQLI